MSLKFQNSRITVITRFSNNNSNYYILEKWKRILKNTQMSQFTSTLLKIKMRLFYNREFCLTSFTRAICK